MSIIKKINASGDIIHVGGAWDVMSALLVQNSKYDAIWLSGLGLSVSRKGRPDASIITFSDIIDVTYHMSNVVSIPIIVDMDSGFGNAINIFYFIKELVKAGASGVCIEDNVFPKSNSFYNCIRKDLVSPQEMQNKIRAAKDSATESFSVIARNESLIVGSVIEDALERCYAYEEAGADGLVVHTAEWGLLDKFLEQWTGKVPLVCIPTKMPQVSINEFRRRGFAMLIFANQALRATIKSSKEILVEIRENGLSQSVENKISTVQDVFDLVNMDLLSQLEQEYLC
ncbi:MAG: isocitrate lyase/PEP mutase family protein [Flavisolibacter sp.]